MITLSNNNTLLSIETKFPLIGMTFLVSFLEGQHKEDLSKQFNYSYDNITWSGWLNLSRDNINTVEVSTYHKLYIQFQFTALTDIENTLALQVDDTFYKTTAFAIYFTSFNLRSLQWVENILEKFLVKSGNLASFIERQNDSNFESFIVFWFGILKYFSYYGKLADLFSSFQDVSVLLAEYLTQKDLILDGTEDITSLQLLQSSFYFQNVKRGTLQIIQENDSQGLKGEFLRLIKKINKDEFLFNVYKTENIGWNIGNSSPLYRGLSANQNFNKYIDSATPAIVDYRMNYSVFFTLNVTGTCTFNISVLAYDTNMTPITIFSHKDNSVSNVVLPSTTVPRTTYVDFHLYNSQSPAFPTEKLSINAGNSLKLSVNVKYILPVITITSGAGTVSGITFVPMFTDYSRGFLMTKAVSAIVANNSNLTKDEICDFTNNKLLPYDRHLLLTNIGDYIYTDSFDPIPHYTPDYDYIGAEPSCVFDEGTGGVFTEQFTEPFI